MSMLLMVQAFELDIKSSTTKLVLLKLADNANDSGYCFPSIDHIATLCCIDRRTVQRHLKKLESDGYLEIKRRFDNNKQRSNEYLLHIASPIESRGGNLTPPEIRGGTVPPGGAAQDRTESLDLSNSKNKTLCSSTNEQIENAFDEVWKVWPAKKNKIASKKAFKLKVRGKPPNALANFVKLLKIDIQERLKANEYAFDRRNLEKHLKNELYKDDIIPDDKVAKSDAEARVRQAASEKAKREMGLK